jgi:protease-4
LAKQISDEISQKEAQISLNKDPIKSVPVAASLRKSRWRWRFFAIAALAVAILALGARFGGESKNFDEDQIARIIIDGVIISDAERLKIISKISNDDKVKAVIVAINSPGGTTAGGEELYEALSLLRDKKPTVAVIHEVGASAAYMSAIATDRIFARRLSIVGSIGVLFQHMNMGKMLDTIGIDFDKVASGPLKAEPDIDDALEGEVRESLQALVDDSYNWFVDIVSERRSLSKGETLELADGRILTGRMALKVGLIDAIGSEAEAIIWLQKTKDLDEGLEVVTRFPLPEDDFEQFLRLVGSKIGASIGLTNPATLDGLVSVWHSGSNK